MIHATAVVGSKAVLGSRVTIGPFAIIEDGATIGDGCTIGAHAVVTGFVTMGKDCQVHPHAVVGGLPQDLGFKGEESFVKIGDGCVIREGVTIHRGTKAGTVTELGNQVFLMSNAHVAHNVKLGNNVIVVSGALLAGHVHVADRAFISGNVVVHQFVRIGRLAMVGGAAAVSKDVLPFMTVRSNSFNELAGMNVVGMRRAGISAASRLEIKRAFQALFLSGLNVSQAVEKLQSGAMAPEVAELCEFIAASKRGVCVCPIKRGKDLDADEE